MIRINWQLLFCAHLVAAAMLLIPQLAQAAHVNPSYKMGAVQSDPGSPSAIDDQVQITEDQASVIKVMSNDSAGQGGSITISAVEAPSQGSAVIEGNAIRYTPPSDFAGVATFRYTIRNASNKIDTATVFVTVLGVNDAPTNITLSNDQVIAEQDHWNLWNISVKLPTARLPSGTTIGAFSTTDPDANDSHTYSLIKTDNVPFTIVGNELRTSSGIFFYERSRQFTLAVRSRDRMGATFDRSFTITVLSTFFPSGPVALSLSSEQIAENQPVSTTVGSLNTADAQSTVHTYQLVSGVGSDDNKSFVINNNSLQTNAVLDYEAKGSYSVRVRSTNGSGAIIEQNFTLNVVDDNNEPNEPAPQNCAGNPIKLLDTTDATVEISAISVSNVSTTGCKLTGKMRVKIRGSEVTGIDFSGRVDEKNQLQSNAGLQAAIQAAGQQVVSADLQEMQISGFTLTLAGLTLKVEAAEIEYYLGRPSLRLTKSQWCMPEEWGGLCTPSSASTSLIDSSGFKPGVNASFSLPNIKLGKKGGANVPTLTGLSAGIKPVDNGYEIAAGGEFGFPKLPKGANGCTLTAALTIYVDPVTGATVMEVSAAAQPQTLTTSNGAALRQVSIGVSCKQGIPIDTTGLQLTGVDGTLSLRPGEQSIALGVTIETEGKLGSFSLATIKGDAKLLWDPQWGFDLSATVKLLNYFKASEAAAKIRPNRFQFTGHVTAALTNFDMTFNAWTDSGSRFHMNGTGQLTLGISKGKLFTGSKDKCRNVTTTVCSFVDDVVSTITLGLVKAKEVCNSSTQLICEKTDIPIPPENLTVSTLRGEFGDFTNGKWGIKTSIQRGQVINDAQKALDFFGVPSEFGVYIDQSGNVAVGSVQNYTLLTPPPIQAALEQWQAVQAAQAAGAGMSVAEDSQLKVVSENEMQVAVPLRLNPENTIRAASVISQVRVTAPTTVTFILATNVTPTLNLIAPDGTTITAANYNQSPVNQHYRINYGQRTIYEVFQQSDMPDRQSARLRFIPIAHHPTLAAVDVLVDGVPVWRNVKPYNPGAPDPDYGGDYIAIEPGPHTIALAPTGQITAVIALLALETRPGIGYTLFTDLGPFGVNNPDTPQLSVVTDAGATPPSFGQPYVRFIHVGRKNRFLDVWVNGEPTFTELGHNDASPYKLLPAGDVNIEVKDEDTGATVIPTHLFQLGESSSVATFFLFDQDSNEAPLGYVGVLDDLYLPRIYTIYQVGGADMGDWKVDVQGQLDDPGLALSVVSFANPTQLSNVTVDASNLSQTKVNWTVKTEFAPTTISLYANPAELTSPLIITDANGIATTEEITNYMGFLVTQLTVTDPAQLNNAVGQLTADLSKLESGTYRLWLQVNDGVNPPRSLYAVKPGTQEIAVITVDNAANFPTAWTPTITTTVNVERALLTVQWTGLIHPDIDSYTLHIGSTAGSSERTDSDLVAYFDRDAAGNPVGGPLVIGNFSNIQPGQNYFLYIEAVDTDTGRAVRSPDFSVSIPAGDYALTTSANEYSVPAGRTIVIPISLNVLSALFQPDVALVIADEGLPRGIRTQFQDDTLGQTVLRSTTDPVAVTAAGATNTVQIVQNKDSQNARADQQTANLVIDVGANVQPGNYVLTIAGYNSASGIRTSQIGLRVLDANALSTFVYLPVIQR